MMAAPRATTLYKFMGGPTMFLCPGSFLTKTRSAALRVVRELTYDCKIMEVHILNKSMLRVMLACHSLNTAMVKHPSVFGTRSVWESKGTWVGGCEQIRKTQDEPQWIVAQRLLSTLTIPGFD